VSNTKYGYIGGNEPEQGGNNNKGVFSISEVQDLVLDDLYGTAQNTRGIVMNYDAKLYGMSGSSVIDGSGNNLNATAYNGLSISTSSSIDYGGAFVFDSSNDYMQRSYNSSYMSGWTSNQTISLWFRSSDMSGRRNLWNQSYAGLGTMTHETGDDITYFYGTNGSDGSPYWHLNSGALQSNGNVVNVCMTRDTTNLKWYLNGVQTGTTTTGRSAVNGGQAVKIGHGYTGDYWGGRMYIIKSHNVALTAQEVLTEFNFYKTRFGL
jgi:hypothetical protein|tara:strand:+ start:3164 stop:3955 length:792 start_codon:yes stop_codon:yes gene_type:complete